MLKRHINHHWFYNLQAKESVTPLYLFSKRFTVVSVRNLYRCSGRSLFTFLPETAVHFL